MVSMISARGVNRSWPKDANDPKHPTLAAATVGSIVKLFVESDDLIQIKSTLPFHFLTVYYSFKGIANEWIAAALDDGDIAMCDKDNDMMSLVLEKRKIPNRVDGIAVKLFVFDIKKTVWVHEEIYADVLALGRT